MYCRSCGNKTTGNSLLCPDCSARAEAERKKQQAHDEWRTQMAQRIAHNSSSRSYTPTIPQEEFVFCTACGTKVDRKANFCPACGTRTGGSYNNVHNVSKPTISKSVPPLPPVNGSFQIACPKCGSTNIDIQMIQENLGSRTVTETKSKYREKRHGCLWALAIGWWWWIVDLMLWICFFPIRFLIQLFKKRDYTGNSKSVSSTESIISRKTICLCKNCGNHWIK